jgi:hypothetical protein
MNTAGNLNSSDRRARATVLLRLDDIIFISVSKASCNEYFVYLVFYSLDSPNCSRESPILDGDP